MNGELLRNGIMSPPRRTGLIVWILVAAAAAGGRAHAKPAESARGSAAHASQAAASTDSKTRSPLTIAASVDANPDAAGRPSPVVLRIYQLKGDAAFSRADFFALLDDDQKALGAELISRDEFVLAPAESRNLDMVISNDARFVAATAGFHDIRNSEWRVLVPGPVKGLTVAVERARVRLFPD